MPTYKDDLQKVKEARSLQASKNTEAVNLEANAQTFNDEVMSRVRKARADRGMSKMAQGIGVTTGQIASDPQRIYDFAGADVRPSTVDAYTSSARARNLSTLASNEAFETRSTADIQDIIGAGSNQLLAQAALKKAEADKAQQEADSLIEEIRLKMEEEKHRVSMASAGGQANYSYTLPNGQVLSGLTPMQYQELYEKYEGGGMGNVDLGKGTQARDMNFFKDIYKSAEAAADVRADEFTGLFDYMKGTVRGWKQKQTPDETAFRTRISDHNNSLRKYISGASIPKAEEKYIKDLMIKGTESDTKVINKLDEAKQYALRHAGSILSTAGYGKIDPEEYFGQDYQINKETRPPLSSFDH